ASPRGDSARCSVSGGGGTTGSIAAVLSGSVSSGACTADRLGVPLLIPASSSGLPASSGFPFPAYPTPPRLHRLRAKVPRRPYPRPPALSAGVVRGCGPARLAVAQSQHNGPPAGSGHGAGGLTRRL